MSSLRHAIGLDIGTRNARAVWVSLQRGGVHLDRVEQIAFPADEQEVAKTLRKWLEQNGLENAFCALSLPGSATVFQPGRIAPNDPRTPDQVAAIDIATYNEMAGDTMGYAIAAQPDPFNASMRAPSARAPEQGSAPAAAPGSNALATRLSLMAMAKQATISQKLLFAEQYHIRPLDLTPAPVALFNAGEAACAAAGAAALRAPHLYIEIGHTQTEIAIGLPTGLLFARSLPVAGKAFTDALAQALGIPFQQAETRKHTLGFDTGDEVAAKALRTVADRWFAQLNGCLSVYRSSFPAKEFAPCAVKITGGGARLRGFPAFVAERARLPLLPAPDSEPPAIAYGLASAMVKPPATNLSLLPGWMRDEVFFKQKKPWWIASAAVLALALGLLVLAGRDALSKYAERNRVRKADLEDRVRVDQSIKEIQKKAGLVAQRSKPLQTLLHNAPLARQALTLACKSVGPQDWITLFCDIESYVPPENPRARAAPVRATPVNRNPIASGRALPPRANQRETKPLPPSNPAAITSYIIEGYTMNPDMTTVRDMIERLKSSPLTAAADLIAADLVLPPAGSESLEPGAKLHAHRHFVIRLDIHSNGGG